MLLFALSLYSMGQTGKSLADTERIVFENDKVKVTEFISSPGKDVCGKGIHSHKPHLSIMLTDARVCVTSQGKTKTVDLKAGTAFWSEAETHTAINNGDNVAKVYLVVVK